MQYYLSFKSFKKYIIKIGKIKVSKKL